MRRLRWEMSNGETNLFLFHVYDNVMLDAYNKTYSTMYILSVYLCIYT